MREKLIPLSVPNLCGNEMKYVEEAVKSGWVSSGGTMINKFEEMLQQYVKSKGAVACQSGTAGLHLALEVCGVTSEHEVIVPTLTFVAAVNPVKYIGANPIFMDCDDSLCMDMDKLEDFLRDECYLKNNELFNSKTNKVIKALVVVHVFGNMVKMDKAVKLAKKYSLKLIEDATEALGTYYESGEYKGKYAGTMGDIGVYSFNGNKIITTGGGGMVVSDNEELLKRIRHLSTQAKSDELYYTHDEIGYNYRMTNLQAALGIGQLELLERFISVKTENYKNYKQLVSKIPNLKILNFENNIRSNYWFYSLYCKDFHISRNELIDVLQSKKIQTRPVWGLIHQQKPYEKYQTYRIEKAIEIAKNILNIPCSSNLTKDDLEYVVNTLKNV